MFVRKEQKCFIAAGHPTVFQCSNLRSWMHPGPVSSHLDPWKTSSRMPNPQVCAVAVTMQQCLRWARRQHACWQDSQTSPSCNPRSSCFPSRTEGKAWCYLSSSLCCLTSAVPHVHLVQGHHIFSISNWVSDMVSPLQFLMFMYVQGNPVFQLRTEAWMSSNLFNSFYSELPTIMFWTQFISLKYLVLRHHVQNYLITPITIFRQNE